MQRLICPYWIVITAFILQFAAKCSAFHHYPSLRLLPQLRVSVGDESPSPETVNPRRAVKRFINLTNGIEIIPALLKSGIDIDELSYIRIQSTHCENSNYYGILESLDNNFLMHCALGNVCLIYDFGSRGTGQLIGTEDHRSGIPRSYWWGIEWIRHSLSEIWNLEDAQLKQRFVRGYNSKTIFDEKIVAMPKALKRRLKYFRPYLLTDTLHIFPIYAKTENDGEKQFYFDLMRSLQFGSQHRSESNLLDRDVPVSSVAQYVQENCVPEGMHIYSHRDFLDIGNNAKRQESPGS